MVRRSSRTRPLCVVLLLLTACGATPVVPPNVLLVSVDTLRADAIGSYGGPVATPNLDGLARQGVRVARALAPSPETGPSHATLLSGRHVSTHGMKQNGPSPFAVLPLAGAFQSAGYATSGVVSSYVMAPHFGWDGGFDRFDAVFEAGRGSIPRESMAPGLRESFDDLDRPGPDTTGIARREIGELEEPFFLFVHYFDPHWPYVRHPENAERAANIDFDLHGRVVANLSRAELRQAVTDYHGEVLFLDETLGRLLAALDERGIADHTLVVLTADHGEGLGQRGRVEHTTHVYDEQIRVPLVLRWPGVLPAGSVVEAAIGLVDVAPTVAALTGVLLRGADGRSIASDLLAGREPEPAPVFGLRRALAALPVRFQGERHFVRTDRWKLIRGSDGPDELYDLEADPRELRNRGAAFPEVIAELGALLEPHRDATTRAKPDLSDEQRESLRALGYAQ